MSNVGVFPNMERIELESINSLLPVDHIQVLTRCPRLRHLLLSGDMGCYVTIPILTRLLVDGYLPHLESLHISQTDEFSGDEMSSCLQAMSRVVEVAVLMCDFG